MVDIATGEPIAAAITFEGVSFENGEENSSGPPYGRYHAFPPPGTYTLGFSASQYATATHEVTIVDGNAKIVEVTLRPEELCDFDLNGTVDLFDFGQFRGCFSGLWHGELPPECHAGDSDDNGDINLADFRVFLMAFMG
ncbi:MAG: peptidase associated/transthyretin-like domain-containing protein [Planctomycetota bacterium]